MYGKSIDSYKKPQNCLSKCLYHFGLSPMANESSCSTSSLALVVVCVLDFGYSNTGIVVAHCGFNLHFPEDI